MIYLFLSCLIGVSIVINMMLNGKLAQRIGMINGVIINFLMATITSAFLCGIMIKSMPSYSTLRAVPLPYFLGGFIGVLTTYLFNLIVPKIPAVYVVILRFIGQMLASATIDYFYLNVFPKGKVIGSLLFLLGLVLNARVDNAAKKGHLAVLDH